MIPTTQASMPPRGLPVIDQMWFAIGPPWGDGTWINAGSADPAGGAFVADLQSPNVDEPDRSADEAAQLAAHICKLHNTDLSRRLLERKLGLWD